MIKRIQLLLLVSTIFNTCLNADDHRKIEMIDPIFYEAQIKNTNLDKAATAMLTINSSGSYYIASDLVVNATGATTGRVFIKINASNVSLNLNSQSIIFNSGSTYTDCIAIEVATGLSNISIYNGSIIGMQGTGIKIGSGCSNIEVKDMLIQKCDNVGMNIAGTSGAPVNNIDIENIIITGCSGASTTTALANAANFANCSNLSIKKSNFNNNVATLSTTVATVTTLDSATALLITDSTGVTIESCNTNSNKGGSCYGLRLTGSKGCSILNCNFTGNEGVENSVYGCSIETCKSIKIEGCTSQSNFTALNDAIGFNIVDSTGLIFKKAIACSNSTIAAATNTYGFKLSNSQGNQFIDSEAITNTSTKLCYGFYLASASNGNLFQSCSAKYNTSSGNVATGGSSCFGFFLTAGKGNRIENCLISGNYSTGATEATNISCGVAFNVGEARSVIINSEISDNSSTAGLSYGIKFGSTGETITNCVLKYNKISNNKGGAKSYGFKDFSADMNSLLVANIAFGHGKIFPLVSNAIVDSGASLNYAFVFSDGLDKATGLIKETDVSTLDTLAISNTDWSNLSLYSR